MHSPPTDEVLERAQTSPIGIVLILGITLTASVAIVVIGSAALENAQDDSGLGQAEQALTQFDSRASQVALGDSQSQSITLGRNSGSYTVDEDAGKIRIYHEDWKETESVDHEYIFGNETDAVPLGALVYEMGGTKIAYQGGGVWRKNDDGGVIMVSSPEFHYRDATLTFPLVRVQGSASVSGNTRARVSRVETARDVYPDTKGVSTDLDKQYKNDSDRTYVNPVQQGNMTVEIESEYCEAWRTYFLERTEGRVTECGDNDTVVAQIVALGTQGDFSITGGNEVKIRGMDPGHSLETLDFEFTDSPDSNSEFNNFQWEMSGSDEEGNEIGLSIERRGGGGACQHGDLPVRTVVYFNNVSNDDYGSFVLPADDDDAFNITCEDDQEVLRVDLLDNTRDVNYTDLDGDDPFDPDGDLHATEEFHHHDADGNESFVKGASPPDSAPLELVVQHYFALLGDADLTISEQQQGSAGLSEGSSGTMEYEGGGQVVTFLHVTENRIEVTLE